MKLISIEKSSNPKKKYMAIFCMCNGCSKCSPVQRKVVHFGAYGYNDFIKYSKMRGASPNENAKLKELAEKHKASYIARHSVNEDFNDPFTAGSLALHILWNKTTLSASVADYKQHFNL